MTKVHDQQTTSAHEVIAAPDDVLFIPTYIPTIEETVKASGAHRQVMC
ncbi:hypothetical protein [Frondihabitans cladoniiphilus]|uniref:Uncharacterized protein n=1 Tax=Frondihabitans cladoniiphilus TaxID=715785 RepID=A0ABP8VW18_9MICO